MSDAHASIGIKAAEQFYNVDPVLRAVFAHFSHGFFHHVIPFQLPLPVGVHVTIATDEVRMLGIHFDQSCLKLLPIDGILESGILKSLVSEGNLHKISYIFFSLFSALLSIKCVEFVIVFLIARVIVLSDVVKLNEVDAMMMMMMMMMTMMATTMMMMMMMGFSTFLLYSMVFFVLLLLSLLYFILGCTWWLCHIVISVSIPLCKSST